jgi:RHS repeat-associated protein
MFSRLKSFVAGAALLLLPSFAHAQETIEYYGLDAIGSVRVVFDSNGTLLSRLDFEPFGRELSASGMAPGQPFAGLFRDSEAGLDYARARSYQLRTGRFSSPDPVYNALFLPQKWNRYAYAGNNPIGNTDTTGRDFVSISFAALSLVENSIPHFQIDVTVMPEQYLGFVYELSAGIIGAIDSLIEPFSGTLQAPGANGYVDTNPQGTAEHAGSIAGNVVPGKAIKSGIIKGASKARQTVLGRRGYREKAQELDARAMRVPPEVWDAMSDTKKRQTNERFLDRTVRRGDEIILSNLPGEAIPGTGFAYELKYLEERWGCIPNGDGTRIVCGRN